MGKHFSALSSFNKIYKQYAPSALPSVNTGKDLREAGEIVVVQNIRGNIWNFNFLFSQLKNKLSLSKSLTHWKFRGRWYWKFSAQHLFILKHKTDWTLSSVRTTLFTLCSTFRPCHTCNMTCCKIYSRSLFFLHMKFCEDSADFTCYLLFLRDWVRTESLRELFAQFRIDSVCCVTDLQNVSLFRYLPVLEISVMVMVKGWGCLTSEI